ncbi:hypothetical protein VTK26DRAFT_2268 [Humicola hyalothermophila]
MTLLPPNISRAIARDFGAEDSDGNGFYRIDCSLTALNGSLDFAFDGVTIQVPYKELIREVPSNPPACFLGIMPSERFALLGDTFLRSAYAVFDLETSSVWMTQATNCGSTPFALNSVQELQSVTGACGLTSPSVTNTSNTLSPSTGAGTDVGSAPDDTTVKPPPPEPDSQNGGFPPALPSSLASRCDWDNLGVMCGLGTALVLQFVW